MAEFTNTQLIDAWVACKSTDEVAKKLGVDKGDKHKISNRVSVLRIAGIPLPPFKRSSKPPVENVDELIEHFAKKTKTTVADVKKQAAAMKKAREDKKTKAEEAAKEAAK